MFKGQNFKNSKLFVCVAVLLIAAASYLGTQEALGFYKNRQKAELAMATMKQPSVPLTDNITDPKALEFARVTMAGSFDYSKEFLVRNRYLNGRQGFNVYVPFRRASGSVVLVNRGWVSEESLAKISRPQGLRKLEGIVTLPSVSAANFPEKDEWYGDDLANMAKKAGVKEFMPIIVNSLEKNEYPISGKINLASAEYRLKRAGLWYLFSLAALLLLI